MKFRQVNKTDCPVGYTSEYTKDVWASENLVFFVTVDRYMYGNRIHISHAAHPGVYFNEHCAGLDTGWVNDVRQCIIDILSLFEENASPVDIEKMLPRQTIRPMLNDEECWRLLQEMSCSTLFL